MGFYIDQHFYAELFEEKKVNNYNKIYLLLFDVIWPQAKNFELFLSSTDNSLKLEYAKKIYKNFAFINDVFLPSFAILNVLNDQYHDLKEQSEGYIPQDHVIHSIHTYIFGIYLFFNSDKINKKIVKLNSNDNFYNLIKDFVLKWQLFALYHDVGYYFEEGKLIEKNLDEYFNVFYEILKQTISKHISRTVTLKALAEKHSSKFNASCVEQGNGAWYDENGRIVPQKTIKEIVGKFTESTCVDAITNDEEFNLLLPLIGNKEYLVVVYDEYGSCVSLIIRKKLEVKKVFSKSNAPAELLLNNILNSSITNCNFRYYLLDLCSIDFWSKVVDEPVVMNDIYSQLPYDLTSNISINNDSIFDILFMVDDWLSNKLTYDSSREKEKQDEASNECLKESFLKECKYIIEGIVQEQNATNKLTEQTFDKISSTFKNNKKTIFETILTQTKELYRQRFAVTHRFVEYCSEQFDELSQRTLVLESMKKLGIFEAKDEESVSFSPFSYDEDNKFHKTLFDSIAKLSDVLGTTLEQLMNYHSPYTEIDHGVFSSCMLFQVVCFLNDLGKCCAKKSELILAWSTMFNEKNHFIEFASESIFSILIHNVYNKKSTPSYGISYCHNIDDNPFSYFCALCDTLQKWGRPKKSNLSKTQLPSIHYLEDEFDIDISHGNIVIRCIKSNIKKTVEFVQESESFLPGISKLIEVNEF